MTFENGAQFLKQPEWRAVPWQPHVNGLKRDVFFPYLTTSDQPQVVVSLGMGEESHAMATAIEILTKAGVPAAVLLHLFHKLPPTSANIHRAVTEGTHAAVHEINDRANQQEDNPIDVLGTSQGGLLYVAAGHEPKLYGDLGTLNPATVTNAVVEGNEDQKRRRLYKNFGMNALKAEQRFYVDSGNLIAGEEIGARLIADIWGVRPWNDSLDTPASPFFRLFKTKTTYASSIVPENLEQTLRSRRSIILTGADDDVYPGTMLKKGLAHAGMTDAEIDRIVYEIPGSHASIHTRRGKEQFGALVRWYKGEFTPEAA